MTDGRRDTKDELLGEVFLWGTVMILLVGRPTAQWTRDKWIGV